MNKRKMEGTTVTVRNQVENRIRGEENVGTTGVRNTDMEDLIRRQIRVTRALSEQEDTSLQMVQTLIELKQTVHTQEMELNRLRQQYGLSTTTIVAATSSTERKNPSPQEYQQEIALYQKKVQEQAQEIDSLQQQVESLSRSCSEKDALLKDRDSVIKVMAQKISALTTASVGHHKEAPLKSIQITTTTCSSQLVPLEQHITVPGEEDTTETHNQDSEDEEVPPEVLQHRRWSLQLPLSDQQEQSMQWLSHHSQKSASSSTSSSQRLRQAKAVREERLKNLMSRFRRGASNNCDSDDTEQQATYNNNNKNNTSPPKELILKTTIAQEDGGMNMDANVTSQSRFTKSSSGPWIAPTVSRDESTDTPMTADSSPASSLRNDSPTSLPPPPQQQQQQALRRQPQQPSPQVQRRNLPGKEQFSHPDPTRIVTSKSYGGKDYTT